MCFLLIAKKKFDVYKNTYMENCVFALISVTLPEYPNATRIVKKYSLVPNKTKHKDDLNTQYKKIYYSV